MCVLQNFFWKALGPEDPDKNNTTPSSFQAYYYNFTPPPQLSDTAATGEKPHSDLSHCLGWLLTRPSEEEEDYVFSLVEWTFLSDDLQNLCLDRMASMRADILNDKAAFRQLSAIHVMLSAPAPRTKAEKTKYHSKLMGNKWISLLYVATTSCSSLTRI
ncbi:hypothetical protein VKT23_016705 [Stygiomarasmius scandens]|uniref:Uncharacterized protein n=1 Tax=Marasmiellus scandens TaxID=2682957 RepID=A0ABR1IU81_9AGAR